MGLSDEKDEAQRPNSFSNLYFNPQYFLFATAAELKAPCAFQDAL